MSPKEWSTTTRCRPADGKRDGRADSKIMGWSESTRGCLFFFSSRRRHTRLQGDWSSDVCSSDLDQPDIVDLAVEDLRKWEQWDLAPKVLALFDKPSHEASIIQRSIIKFALSARSEERRVGKEGRSRWSPYH